MTQEGCNSGLYLTDAFLWPRSLLIEAKGANVELQMMKMYFYSKTVKGLLSFPTLWQLGVLIQYEPITALIRNLRFYVT